MRKMKDSGIEWIGEIPRTWSVSRIKFVCNFEPNCDFSHLKEDSIITYTPMEYIKNGYYIPNTAQYDTISHSLTTYQEGDIVMAKVTPCFENGNIAIMNDLSSKVGMGSSELFVFRASRINVRYLFYWLRNDIFIQSACSTMTGTGGLKRVSPTFVKNCYIHLPNEEEQKAIADFLDRRCAEIDAVIEQTKITIEEYKKLKQSVITEAVTKGIRGNRPMKDSGNTWYGCIPSEWDIRKLKYVFTIKKDIAGKEGYTVLSITQKGVVPKNISSNEGQLAESYSNYQLVAIGDFAMNHMDLLTGWVDISKHEGVTSPDYRVFVLNDTINNCKQYYLYLMQMCYSNRIFYGLGQGVSGMGRWRLQADKFLNFTIPIPPTQEQQEIADYLDQKCVEIDALVTKKEQIVVELEAYKKSLIYEVVTGKREIC